MKFINRRSSKEGIAILVFVCFVLIFGGLVVASAINSESKSSNVSMVRYGQANGRNESRSSGAPRNDETHTVTPLEQSAVSNNPTTTESLLYIIEEEKLAHDVYQVMFELWGSRVFGNIRNSEASHQAQVLSVMQNRNITDPRSDEVGVFSNQSLQKLYNELIAQGSQSTTEAFKVGVAIEELDINDLKEDIDALDSADTDVRAVYESLLRGSERHLVAFNRQLSR